MALLPIYKEKLAHLEPKSSTKAGATIAIPPRTQTRAPQETPADVQRRPNSASHKSGSAAKSATEPLNGQTQPNERPEATAAVTPRAKRPRLGNVTSAASGSRQLLEKWDKRAAELDERCSRQKKFCEDLEEKYRNELQCYRDARKQGVEASVAADTYLRSFPVLKRPSGSHHLLEK